MANLYPHLNDKYQDIATQSKEERILHLHAEVHLKYPKAKKVHAILNHFMSRPRKARMQNLLITGDSNMGKTSIIRSFAKEHQDYGIEDENGISHAIKPVILALASDNADVKHLYISILEAFHIPFHPTDPLAKLRHQMFYLLRETDVKMLIIDEIHHFLRGTPKQQRNVMDALKNIGNELMIPLVCVGIPEASTILTSDEQLRSRFDEIQLTKWELDKNFLGLLQSFEKILPLKKASNLVEKEKATLLYNISEGNLGDLHRLLIECATYAIENDIEEITLDIINKFLWLKPTTTLASRVIPV